MKTVKHQKAPLGQSVLTNFVANLAPKQVPSAQWGVVSRLRNRCGEEKVTGYLQITRCANCRHLQPQEQSTPPPLGPWSASNHLVVS